ncbi:hypothetical protein XI09_11000 [Bradyrhizobium sp. CCBAU 11386]|nr:hypothetical protein [Bradyrhizobium sp. CCBAU 11386]
MISVNDRVIAVPKLRTLAHTRDKIVKEIGSLKRHFRSVLSIWAEAARVPPSDETTKGPPLAPARAMQARFNQLEAEMDAFKSQPVYDPADMAAGLREEQLILPHP